MTITFLEGVGSPPAQDDDLRHPEGPFDGRVIGRADFLGKAQKFVGLDFGKLVHHDLARGCFVSTVGRDGKVVREYLLVGARRPTFEQLKLVTE